MQVTWARTELKALIGGEALTADLAREILSRCGQLWNLYGPTETTVWSTVSRIERLGEITIGKPIANKEIYIVDRHDQAVPVGVAGELLIGGSGLAREYLCQPQMTAERFIPHRFSAAPGMRLYRTGDLGRYLPSGNIQFLGRIDHQVKIRGFRVELGEVEAAMMQHPGIDQCVVVDRENQPGETCLVAYVVPIDHHSAPGITGLRAFLKQKLPDYMIPTVCVTLGKLPLTATGKIDRMRLPLPHLTTRESESALVLPRNTLERQLINVLEDLLHIQPIGRKDDFFELGGHSLLAVRLIGEINKAFNIHLPLATIFRAPTAEELADVVRNHDELKPRAPGLIVPRRKGRGPAIFWAPSVGSIERYVECHNLARVLGEHFYFYGFDPAPEFTDIAGLAQHCIRLMRTEQPCGPYSVAGFCQSGHVAYEIAQRLEAEGETLSLLALLDCSARDFGANLRQRYHWLRDGFRGEPREVIRRIRSAIRRRMTGANGHDPLNTNEISETPFSLHAKAAFRHKAKRFRSKIALFRSDEMFVRFRHTPKFGWDALAGTVDLHTVPCRHSVMLSDPVAVGFIADNLKNYLKQNNDQH